MSISEVNQGNNVTVVPQQTIASIRDEYNTIYNNDLKDYNSLINSGDNDSYGFNETLKQYASPLKKAIEDLKKLINYEAEEDKIEDFYKSLQAQQQAVTKALADLQETIANVKNIFVSLISDLNLLSQKGVDTSRLVKDIKACTNINALEKAQLAVSNKCGDVMDSIKRSSTQSLKTNASLLLTKVMQASNQFKNLELELQSENRRAQNQSNERAKRAQEDGIMSNAMQSREDVLRMQADKAQQIQEEHLAAEKEAKRDEQAEKNVR